MNREQLQPHPHIKPLSNTRGTVIETFVIGRTKVTRCTNEFWTPKQRQASSLHEVSYRACFKPQLPNYFISLFTDEKETVYDPFNGRGTTTVEAALMGRNIIANDINPLSRIFTEGRLSPPDVDALKERLDDIPVRSSAISDIDLSMFYHKKTLSEIVSLKNYLIKQASRGSEDEIDKWIRMVATNRLTGHSRGFFSVYTLPPNQAVSRESQKLINKKLRQRPEYKEIKKIILEKSIRLLRNLTTDQRRNLKTAAARATFIRGDARNTKGIKSGSVRLTVTSPPFLDIVDYRQDNWLRCWFNNIDADAVGAEITMSRKLADWTDVMGSVFRELYRITKKDGHVAFEVGELRNGKIKLDEHVVPLGIAAGFRCKGIIINAQSFTKTSNIWGVNNNSRGTNTNRIVLFCK